MKRPIQVFMPPNILKAKLGSLGGGLDIAAIKRAEDAIASIKGEFPAWIAQDIDVLNQACNSYLKGEKKSLGRLYRSSLDLKGQASTFEYPLIARIATSLCRLLETPNISARIVNQLARAHVDAIRVAYRDKIKTTPNATALQLAEALEAQVSLAIERTASAAQ